MHKLLTIGALAVVFLAGCASLTDPDNEIRITEYAGSASGLGAITGQAVVGGVRVVEQGETRAQVIYCGERATVCLHADECRC